MVAIGIRQAPRQAEVWWKNGTRGLGVAKRSDVRDRNESRSGVDLMHRYTVFGLNFASDVEFPHLLQGDGAEEFVIYIGRVAAQPPAELSNFVAAYWWSEDSFCLRWTDVATCQVRGTDEIIIDIAPGAEMARVVQFVLGPAIGALLHLRGVFALHASAVEIGGRAVLFIGDKGQGKSTLAAKMYDRGHGFISDDIVPITLLGDQFVVSPAYPQVKLWPDAIESMGRDPESLPRLSDLFDKRSELLEERFRRDPLPLAAIYQLRTTERGLKIERLVPQKALMALMQNIYAVRFGDVLFKASDTKMLTMSAEIVTRAPLMRLNRPSSLAMLDQGAKLVEEQVFGGSFQDIEAATAAESEAIPATF